MQHPTARPRTQCGSLEPCTAVYAIFTSAPSLPRRQNLQPCACRLQCIQHPRVGLAHPTRWNRHIEDVQPIARGLSHPAVPAAVQSSRHRMPRRKPLLHESDTARAGCCTNHLLRRTRCCAEHDEYAAALNTAIAVMMLRMKCRGTHPWRRRLHRLPAPAPPPPRPPAQRFPAFPAPPLRDLPGTTCAPARPPPAQDDNAAD